MHAFNFIVHYSDGSIYQGRVYSDTLEQATRTIIQELPAFPGDPQPIRLSIDMKTAG